jgi:UV DNA damage repair endonuclease
VGFSFVTNLYGVTAYMSDKSNTKRTKVAGREKGTPNKVSATVKENIICVFTRLGSTAAMAEWAEENKTEFYRMYSRLAPISNEVSGPDGSSIPVSINVNFG